MVVVRNIEVYALCEGCLLPFRLRCHVAYIPSGERVVGLSKIARVADLYAKRLQTPIQFVEELAQAFADALNPEPLGVAVLAESWHLQWPGVCVCVCMCVCSLFFSTNLKWSII
jgi:GTP cyclohydrolase I